MIKLFASVLTIASGYSFSGMICCSMTRKLVSGFGRLQVIKSVVGNGNYRSYCYLSDDSFSTVKEKKSGRRSKISDKPALEDDKSSSIDLSKKSRRKVTPVADLTLESAKEELKKLNAEINIHDDLYYNQHNSSIPDREYDKILQRASVIIGRFNELSSFIDHFSRVGAGTISSPSEAGSSFIHSSPMLSLDNAFSATALTKALEKMESENTSINEFVIEPKIDGLSLAIIYKNGKIHRAGTRGDGNVGEDMTRAVKKYIPQIPHKLAGNRANDFEVVEVRGEVFIGRNDFIQMNQLRADRNLTLFSTARNAAAGSLRKLNIVRKTKKSMQEDSTNASSVDVETDDNYSRLLNFFAYSLHTQPKSGSDDKSRRGLQTASTQWGVLDELHDMGFQVATPKALIEGMSMNEVIKVVVESCTTFEARKDAWAFDADGVVVKVNSIAEQNRLGTSRTAPKWAIAYKFTTETVETTLEEITVQVGRTGFLTPVAKLTPVTISGVTVGKATLHNEHEVRRLGLYPGCKVKLVRAGDVIPRIVGLATSELAPPDNFPLFELPSHCPVCGSATARDTLIATTKAKKSANTTTSNSESLSTPPDTTDGFNFGEESVGVRCTGGFTCSAQAIEQLRHFCSRDAMDIAGLSSSKIADLYEGGYVKTVADLYLLRTRDLTAAPSSSLEDANSTTTTASTPPESLRKRKSWGDTSVNNLLAAIDSSRNDVPMHRLLFALGIRGVGIQNAKDISKLYSGNFLKFWQDVKAAAANLTDEEAVQLARENLKVNSRKKALQRQDSDVTTTTTTTTTTTSNRGVIVRDWREEFAFLRTASEKITTSLFAFARNRQSVEVVDALLDHVNIVGDFVTEETKSIQSLNGDRDGVLDKTVPPPTQLEGESLPLKGRVILFTGKAKFSRADMISRCEQLGATCVTTINKSVNLLIDCHDSSAISSKRKKALEKGIEVWNEGQLLSTINML